MILGRRRTTRDVERGGSAATASGATMTAGGSTVTAGPAAPDAALPGRARRSARTRSRERWFYLLVSPWLVGLVVLQLVPFVAATALGFTSWEPPLAPRWVGLDNLAALAGDGRFARAIVNTAVYGAFTVVPALAIGLGIALLLGGIRRGGTLLRSTVLMPAILAGVATALLWGWILNPRYGLLDAVLGLAGIDGPAWLRDPAWAMAGMVLIGWWNVGINVVVYLVALGAVPRELLDAAALDGAGRMARFRFITWPALLPITFYLAMVNAIAASQVFTPIYVLTRGGPDDATLTTALYVYQAAFGSGQLGYASAMAIVVFLGVVALTGVAFRVAGRRVPFLGADA